MIVNKNTYYIAHNGVNVFHYGWVEVGQSLESGQPNIETFTIRASFLTRCTLLKIDINVADVPHFAIDLTPPTLTGYGVVIPSEFLWVFPDEKFVLNGFEIPLVSVAQGKAVDVAYFLWVAFRNELDSGRHDYLKRALMPLWDYVELQVIQQNLIAL